MRRLLILLILMVMLPWGSLHAQFKSEVIGKFTDQSIKGDDVDSTAENFVFDDAYRGTSAESDSAYATEFFAKVMAGDTATVLRGEFVEIDGDTLSGSLRATILESMGNVYVNKDSTAADAVIYFSDDDQDESFHWDQATSKFELSDDLDVTGDITVSGTVDTVDIANLGAVVENLTDDSATWDATAAAFDTNYVYLIADTMVVNDSLAAGKIVTIGGASGTVTFVGTTSGSIDITVSDNGDTMLVIDSDNDTTMIIRDDDSDNIYWEVEAGQALTIRTTTLEAMGNLHVNKDSTDADAVIYFSDNDEDVSVHWDDANNQFEFSDGIDLATGNLDITSGNITLSGTVDGRDLSDDEWLEDEVGEMLGGTETGIAVSYSDGDNDIDFVVAADIVNHTLDSAEVMTIIADSTIDSTDFNQTQVDEFVEDLAGGMLGGTETGIAVTYEDGTDDIDFVVAADIVNHTLDSAEVMTIIADSTIDSTDFNQTQTDEYVDELIGAHVTGNTETGIAVTHEDGDNTLDFVVDADIVSHTLDSAEIWQIWQDTLIGAHNIVYLPLGSDIDSAVNAATAGDVIRLAGGTYTITDDIDIAKAITIVGQGCTGTTISTTTDSKNVFHITASNVLIRDMCIDITASATPAIMADGSGGTVLTNVNLSHLDINLNSHAGAQHAILYTDASGDIRVMDLAVTSSDDAASGIYIQNESSAEAATEVHAHSVVAEVAGASGLVIAFHVEDDGAGQDCTLKMYGSQGLATDAGAISAGLSSHGGANALAYGESCIFSATDYDVYQATSGVAILSNCALLNNSSLGTITLDGYNWLEGLRVGTAVNIGDDLVNDTSISSAGNWNDAHSRVASDSANWTDAFGWGDHSAYVPDSAKSAGIVSGDAATHAYYHGDSLAIADSTGEQGRANLYFDGSDRLVIACPEGVVIDGGTGVATIDSIVTDLITADTGIFADALTIPQDENPTGDTLGRIGQDADAGALRVFDTVGTDHAALMPFSKTLNFVLWNPDLITDTICFLLVDSSIHPGGIEIVHAEIQMSEDAGAGTYLFELMYFTDADPPVLSDFIDTLVVANGDSREQSVTFENTTIAIGQQVAFLAHDDDIDWIRVSITYYVKDND